ncbi:MAG: SpoIID/LytB domain-containing protein [Defluviitaleaceae bacterium]|nr:SpoIID/LytB domain-containing protein [Defluviitaleaceae bacterium]
MKKASVKFLFFLLMTIVLSSHYFIFSAYANPLVTNIRIGLLDDFSKRTSITINNTSIIYNQHHRLESSIGFTIRPYYVRQIALYSGNQRLRIFNDPIQLQDSNGGLMLLDGTAYRGAIEFALLDNYGLTAINILPLEEYLFSVVPSEMPASWHPEALKAQAVAARTYTIFTMSRGSVHTGFDLCDRVHCQVYRGVEWENTASTQAVLATTGLALYFNGQLIEAVYFASSGGNTENSENVWLESRPYLRSVPDIHEHEPVVWNRTFTLSEITTLLNQNNHSIGTATGIYIGGSHPSGRVESLIISGTTGQVILTGEEIRTFFSTSIDGSLKSRNFTLTGDFEMLSPINIAIFDGHQVFDISPVGLYGISAQGNASIMESFSKTSGSVTIAHGESVQPPTSVLSDVITINGRGFGHGVGMSQRGANGMALRGYTFRDILAHFYRNTTLR